MPASETRPVLIIGGGDHAKVLIDALQLLRRPIVGIADIDPARKGERVLGVEILGGDEVLERHKPGSVQLVNAVGSTKSLDARAAVYERLAAAGWSFSGVVHPAACVSPTTLPPLDAQIMAGAVVQTSCRIGANCIINTRASIDHDCVVGDHVHIAPGVTLSGGVTIGPRTHIGTGAVIIQGITIGAGCLIAAGAVVTRDVPDRTIARGSPARHIPLTR